jgi:hypothetical protein
MWGGGVTRGKGGWQWSIDFVVYNGRKKFLISKLRAVLKMSDWFFVCETSEDKKRFKKKFGNSQIGQICVIFRFVWWGV